VLLCSYFIIFFMKVANYMLIDLSFEMHYIDFGYIDLN